LPCKGTTEHPIKANLEHKAASHNVKERSQKNHRTDSRGTTDPFFSSLLGLNYYVYRHNLKLMTGVEYNDMTGGKQSFSGWTYLAGVRLAF